MKYSKQLTLSAFIIFNVTINAVPVRFTYFFKMFNGNFKSQLRSNSINASVLAPSFLVLGLSLYKLRGSNITLSTDRACLLRQ